MKSYTLIIMFAIMMSIIGCQKEETNQIHTELATYFDRFEAEAYSRGIEIDMDNIDISGYVGDIDQRGVLGTCTSFTDGSKVIDIEESYWNRIDDLQKEYLVFHELGHCILERVHKNDRDENGYCQSIMQSGEGSCRSLYNVNNRTEMLDELFTN